MLGSKTLSAQSSAWMRVALWAGVVALGVGIVFIAQTQPALLEKFPETWNLGLRQPINDFQSWVIGHRSSHPVFAFFFDPLSDLIDFGLRRVEDFLLITPWYLVVLAFGLVGYWLAGWRLTLLAVGGLLFCGLVGLWEESMQTLALMSVSVFISLLIGIPLGIIASRSAAFEAALRPLLDGMQTMPAFVYLIPVLLFFGVARVPSVVATVIYALPPAIRLTTLGIRQVILSAIEAARSFGSTPRQMLLKVELPLALPSIMTGVNQTIMMALGIVVIAALIGAGGLGREVTISLQRLKVGDAFEAGMAIVLLAIILDRLSDALSKYDFTGVGRRQRVLAGVLAALQLPAKGLAWLVCRIAPLAGRRANYETVYESLAQNLFLINSVLIVAALWLADALAFHSGGFPSALNIRLDIPADAVVRWMRDNLYEIGGSPFGTGPLSDFITLQMMNPLRDLLVKTLPWATVILWVAALAFTASGWRLALAAAVGFFTIGLLGMWEAGMDTLSQCIIAIFFTIIIAVPVGVLTSRNDAAQMVLRPLLDTLQTIPPFVYLVPVIMLFNIGRVPGLIAAVLYALPPGIKLVDLGIRQVPVETVEAATAFGSTGWQTLFNVQLPLALPSILVGINQMIMMVLSMVIIAGMVGGAGLGLEAVTGLARSDTGRGIEAGLAIVALAIVIDRITQAWTTEK
ncbi:MAG: ABC transporter permease subunit [Chloroflexi bacterium]|nr:ABC transporter permease subunit [Chloroflexota bacterium]